MAPNTKNKVIKASTRSGGCIGVISVVAPTQDALAAFMRILGDMQPLTILGISGILALIAIGLLVAMLATSADVLPAQVSTAEAHLSSTTSSDDIPVAAHTGGQLPRTP